MKTFTSYLSEAKTSSNLDMNFIARAQRVTSFNLDANDFTDKPNRKTEIQYLFSAHFFPDFDIFSKGLNDIDVNRLNGLIEELRRLNATNLESLFYYNLKGVGPGEILLYYLVNNAFVQGGTSKGVDIRVGSKAYEVKAVIPTRDNYAYDFALGSSVSIAGLISDIMALGEEIGQRVAPGRTTDISKLREKAPGEFSKLEQRFAEKAANYFRGQNVIFLDNRKSTRGRILAAKEIQAEDIQIRRIVRNTIEPLIRL